VVGVVSLYATGSGRRTSTELELDSNYLIPSYTSTEERIISIGGCKVGNSTIYSYTSSLPLSTSKYWNSNYRFNIYISSLDFCFIA